MLNVCPLKLLLPDRSYLKAGEKPRPQPTMHSPTQVREHGAQRMEHGSTEHIIIEHVGALSTGTRSTAVREHRAQEHRASEQGSIQEAEEHTLANTV